MYSPIYLHEDLAVDMFFVKKIIETGPGMLYMVGKIFLYGMNLNIVYSESGHKI